MGVHRYNDVCLCNVCCGWDFHNARVLVMGFFLLTVGITYCRNEVWLPAQHCALYALCNYM